MKFFNGFTLSKAQMVLVILLSDCIHAPFDRWSIHLHILDLVGQRTAQNYLLTLEIQMSSH
jgi:hypothetical protein